MNLLEQAWAGELELTRRAGIIEGWVYEGVKLRLAKNTWYTPDFFVVLASGEVEIHETKGHWEDDARVKIKVAAEFFPWFTFKAIQRGTKREQYKWKIETIPAPAECR